jgi:hypothetical protein
MVFSFFFFFFISSSFLLLLLLLFHSFIIHAACWAGRLTCMALTNSWRHQARAKADRFGPWAQNHQQRANVPQSMLQSITDDRQPAAMPVEAENVNVLAAQKLSRKGRGCVGEDANLGRLRCRRRTKYARVMTRAQGRMAPTVLRNGASLPSKKESFGHEIEHLPSHSRCLAFPCTPNWPQPPLPAFEPCVKDIDVGLYTSGCPAPSARRQTGG